MLRRELHKQGADPNDSFLLHTILKKKFKRERKRRKLLLAALTYSEVDVNLRDATGMTALHCAVEVSKEMISTHAPIYTFIKLMSSCACMYSVL